MASFPHRKGVTQGDLVSPTIFTTVVDALLRAVQLEVCVPQETQNGFRLRSSKNNICFYSDDGRIAGHNPIWVHTGLTAMVRIFERLVLQKSLSKTKSMICTP